jgi:hypothetical protein
MTRTRQTNFLPTAIALPSAIALMAPRRTLLCVAAVLTDSPSTAVAVAAAATRINLLLSLSSETAAEETATIATEEKTNAESFMVIGFVVALIPK